MALFNKLFSSSKKKPATASPAQNIPSPFPFSNDQVRVLLYRECDWRGKRLLFDSSAIECINNSTTITSSTSSSCSFSAASTASSPSSSSSPSCSTSTASSSSARSHQNGNNSSSSSSGYSSSSSHRSSTNSSYHIEYCDGFTYKYGKPNADYNNLGEMVFGSVAMSFRGTTLKVHWLQAPARLMCSQVFLSPIQTSNNSSYYNNNNGSDSNNNINHNNSSSNPSARDSISSLDTSSIHSFSLSLSLCVSDSLSNYNNNNINNTDKDKSRTIPLDMPNSEINLENGRFFPHSAGDSGFSEAARYPCSSARSSLASIYSDFDGLRKLSIDSYVPDVMLSSYCNNNGNSNSTTNNNRSYGGDGNIQRRIMRNISTSFENRSSLSDYIGHIGDISSLQLHPNQHPNHSVHFPSISTISTQGGGVNSDGCVAKMRRNSEVTEITKRKAISGDALTTATSTASSSNHFLHHHNGYGPNLRSSSRRPRLGIVVCITLTENFEKEMQSFCSEHMTLLESMLSRLRATAENAYVNRQHFLQIMLRGWHSASLWLTDLFTAPRLANPIWLTLSSGNMKQPISLANSFMSELSTLLQSADTKDSNFFVSTLLTAVLTNHLGWVGTVAPFSTFLNKQRENMNQSTTTTISKLMEFEKMKMSELAKEYPYNVLWAQLGDLYGSIGYPIKLTKTIICGSNVDTIQQINKLLNILTYFIRCGELSRNVFAKNIEKNTIDAIIEKQNIVLPCKLAPPIGIASSSSSTPMEIKKTLKNGLTRSSTRVKNLSLLNGSEEIVGDLQKILRKNVMNDIPKVLAYRDSRFVKQELRIGNYSMDTGIEMNDDEKLYLKKYQIKPKSENDIKLILTSPDNENCYYLDDDEQIELIGIENKEMGSNSTLTEDTNAAIRTVASKKGLFTKSNSKMNLEHIKKTKLVRKSSVPKIETQPAEDQEESIPVIEANKSSSTFTSAASYNDLVNLDASKVQSEDSGNSNVVFVLGDDEKLIGLKEKSHPNELTVIIPKYEATKKKQMCSHKAKKHSGVKFDFEKYPKIATNYMKNINMDMDMEDFLEKGRKMERDMKLNSSNSTQLPSCSKHNALDDASDEDEECDCCKSGGGLQYLQTPTNASELEFSNDISEIPHSPSELKDISKPVSSTSSFVSSISNSDSETNLNEVVESKSSSCCHKIKKHSGVKFNFEQYPQIATKYMKSKNLDIDDINVIEKGLKMEREMCEASTSKITQSQRFNANSIEEEDQTEECKCCRDGNNPSCYLQTPTNASELEFSSNDINIESKLKSSNSSSTLSMLSSPSEKITKNIIPIQRDINITTVDENAELTIEQISDTNTLRIIDLPMPKIEKSNKVDEKLMKPGFMPSLLTGLSDHYMSDMILQGITSPPSKWENNLKQDLTISSHCATIEQIPAENVAIIANLDNWDVRVVSSHCGVMQTNNNCAGIVGMSQLISSMLETVHAMWLAGTSAFQCMSFIESKLQEFYLQSETLAAFLLGTEFCTLASLTSSLDLTANDIPLLLSIASIHSPQVTKKCGVSFR